MNVSVIIPAYNEDENIAKTILSVKNQSRAVDEILIVDNNSTDRTVEIAKGENVKIISEKKQGLSFTRNTGFNKAESDILIKLDADTSMPENAVEEILKTFSDPEIIGVGLNLRYDNKFATMLAKGIYIPSTKVLRHKILYGPCYAIRKEIWEKLKNDIDNRDNRIHEDLEIARCISKYGKIEILDDVYIDTDSRRFKSYTMYSNYILKYLNNIRKSYTD